MDDSCLGLAGLVVCVVVGLGRIFLFLDHIDGLGFGWVQFLLWCRV